MVPRGLGDGSIIGTTVLSSQQPQNQHQSQPQHSGTVSRQVKGILKRAPVNPNQESVQQPLSGGSASMASTASTAGSSAGGSGALSQNKWDYELSPSSTDTTNKSEQHGGQKNGSRRLKQKEWSKAPVGRRERHGCADTPARPLNCIKPEHLR